MEPLFKPSQWILFNMGHDTLYFGKIIGGQKHGSSGSWLYVVKSVTGDNNFNVQEENVIRHMEDGRWVDSNVLR